MDGMVDNILQIFILQVSEKECLGLNSSSRTIS